MIIRGNPNRAHLKIWTDEGQTLIDEKTIAQAMAILELPFIYRHVALMPDAHVGIGATIGSVIATDGAIIPSAVGVDIGCSMSMIHLNIPPNYFDDKPDEVKKLYNNIRRTIPTGFPCSWTKIPDIVRADILPRLKPVGF